jgi:hypothetical protein
VIVMVVMMMVVGMLPVVCSGLFANREPYLCSTVNHLPMQLHYCNMDAARCDWSDLFAFFMFECEAVDEADAYSKNHTSQGGGSREIAMTMRTRWSAVPAVAYIQKSRCPTQTHDVLNGPQALHHRRVTVCST